MCDGTSIYDTFVNRIGVAFSGHRRVRGTAEKPA